MSPAAVVVASLLSTAPCADPLFCRARGEPVPKFPAGIELFWCTRTIPFMVNERGSRSAGAAASIAAVVESFRAWEQSSCSDLKFLDRGTTPRTDVGYDPATGDRATLVVWREKYCSEVVPANDPCLATESCNNKYDCWSAQPGVVAITRPSVDNATGEILKMDIELNGASADRGSIFTAVDSPTCPNDPPPSPPDCVARDIRNTVTHEVGHVIGLADNSVPESTMYATAFSGELKKRVVGEGDFAGLCSIYPKGKTTAGCTNTVAGGCGCAASGAGSTLGSLALALVFWMLPRRRACRRGWPKRCAWVGRSSRSR